MRFTRYDAITFLEGFVKTDSSAIPGAVLCAALLEEFGRTDVDWDEVEEY